MEEASRFAHRYSGESEWRRIGAADKAANVETLCRDVPHATLLEIGAGEGSILARLAERGFAERTWALEISASGVEAIRARQIEGLVECRVFDGESVPYDDGAFDLAVLSHVLEHAEHPRRLLVEASRVARHVFVEVPLEHTARLPDDYVPDSLGHINFFSRKTLRRFVQTCDLEVVGELVANRSRASFEHGDGRAGALKWLVKEGALRAAPGLAPLLWTYHMAVLCRGRS